MVIEWLTFRVPAEQREAFVQVDGEIWTSALQQYPGFIAKETWIDPQDDTTVILVIRWRTREEWKAIPAEDLAAVGAQFDAALNVDYTLETSREFQVRRFPISSQPSR